MIRELREKIALPGGQDRVREAILYVAWECRYATRFGQTKLHKILWRADFQAFAARGVPVTGRKYQRLPQGPCLHEMVPVQADMIQAGLIYVSVSDLGNGFTEERVVPYYEPRQSLLSDKDLFYLDAAILHYWDKTARETSDESHGVIWKTHGDRQTLPYELALLTDQEPGDEQLRRLEILGQQRRWQSA